MHKGNQKGFTLIELLVVIAIIAILSAILFPVFARVREKARQTSCASNERQIGMAFAQYVNDYDEQYPVGWQFIFNPAAPGWVLDIQPYVKDNGVFFCPDDSKAGTQDPSGWGVNISYGVNGSDNNGGWTHGNDVDYGLVPASAPWLSALHGTNLSIVSQVSASILLTERHADEENGSACIAGANPSANTVGSVFTGPFNWGWIGDAWNIPDGTRAAAAYPNGPNGSVSAKHTDRANFLFVDGHVKSMIPSQTNPDPVNLPDKNLWNAHRP